MAKISYWEQLRDPRWQRKRLEVMEVAQWECQNCGDKTTTLNVHHPRYIKGRMAWEYEADELRVLCEPCHEQEHASRDLLNRMLAEAGPGAIEQIVGLVGGYLDGNLAIESGLAFMAYEGHEPFYEIGIAASAVECLDVDGWRSLVRQIAERKSITPSIRTMIDKWDEWDKKKSENTPGA